MTKSFHTMTAQEIKEHRDLCYQLANEAEREGSKELARELRREAMSYGMAW